MVYNPKAPMGDVGIPKKRDPDIHIKIIGGTPVLPLITIALIISNALRRFGFSRIDIQTNDGEDAPSNAAELADDGIVSRVDDLSVLIESNDTSLPKS